MRESQCRLEMIVCCTGTVADIGCKHFQESKQTPLKCAHRDDTECISPIARQEALSKLLAKAVSSIIVKM